MGNDNGNDNGNDTTTGERIDIGTADGDRVFGIIDRVSVKPARAASPNGKKPATPLAFTFHGAVGDSVARATSIDGGGQYHGNVSTKPAETAAVLAFLGIDLAVPTREAIEASPAWRALNTTLTASARALSPVAVVFPVEADAVPAVDADTLATLMAAARSL